MKAIQLTLTFILVPFFMGSFAPQKKEAPLLPYVTFVNDVGEERTLLLSETSSADWKDKISNAELRRGDLTIETSGILVFAPKQGDAIILVFKDAASLTSIFQKLGTEYTLIAGDRIILDNIRDVKLKRWLMPIVITLK